MTDKRDEISLKDAAGYLPKPYSIQTARGRMLPLDDPEVAARQKRERETGEATAVLEAMLAAGRAGKTVRGHE